MKLGLGLIIAVCFAVGGMALAQELVPIASADDGVVHSVYEIESLAVSIQNQFLPIAPPSESVFVQSLESIVPVDWRTFPKEFTKRMVAEMDSMGYPLYRILVYEDPVTRETVFLNRYDQEVYRLPPEKGYDPYAWQTAYFELEPGEVLDDWTRWLYDPAKIAAELLLIPQLFFADYLADQQTQAELEVAVEPVAMTLLSGKREELRRGDLGARPLLHGNRWI